MTNFGANSATIFGFLFSLSGILYWIISIIQISIVTESSRNIGIELRIFQTLFVPSFLILSGLILVFQGWRLDPLLQFQEFLLFIVILYLIFLDLQKDKEVIDKLNKNVKKKLFNKSIALLINFFIPGIGTIIAGNFSQGLYQLFLALTGLFFPPLCMIAFIWSIYTVAKIKVK